jgi:triosephosphate isomerase (TIM)
VMEMQLFIRKVLTNQSDRAAAAAVTILYGGSVKPDTASMLYREGGVDGFLVGGASLALDEFTKIITAVL